MLVRHRLLAVAIAAMPIAALCAPPKLFFGSLSGPQESPPNASPGVGFAVVTYDPDTFMEHCCPDPGKSK